MDQLVTIKKSELIKLLDRDYSLRCLERDGVDNWEWYGESFDEYELESHIKDKLKQLGVE